jgi:hypothetical protein
MVGDGKYLFLTFKKPIESEPKKRNGCHQITNLNKKLTNKKYIMDTNAVLDLMWVLICGILVFFMQVLRL